MHKTLSNSPRAQFLDRDAVVQRLRSCAREIRSRDRNIKHIILFGSLSNGNYSLRSDADILVLLHTSSERFVDRIGRYLMAFIDSPVAVDVFPYTAKEAEKNPIAQNALTTGMVLA